MWMISFDVHYALATMLIFPEYLDYLPCLRCENIDVIDENICFV